MDREGNDESTTIALFRSIYLSRLFGKEKR